MEKKWTYVVNPITTSTKANYRKALLISSFHLNALQANITIAFILALYNYYLPIHNAFAAAYTAWEAQQGAKEGKTTSLKEKLAELRKTKIKEWDIGIQNVYLDGTPEYTALLPNHRVDFQSGKQLPRITAIKTLSTAIGSDAALADIKADIDDFYAIIKDIYDKQQGSKSSTKTKSTNVESARVAMCNAQFGNLGKFIQEYCANPDSLTPYFFLEEIQRKAQDFFMGAIKPERTKFLRRFTFKATSKVKILNKGNCDLYFYIVQTKFSPVPELVLTVHPGEEITTLASAMGNISNRIIMIGNSSVGIIGKYEFTFL